MIEELNPDGVYKQDTAIASVYQRSNRVQLVNPEVGLSHIEFYEERVVNVNGEKVTQPLSGVLVAVMDDPSKPFPLLGDLDEYTGLSMTYAELYGAIHSLYYHLAHERDKMTAAGIEPRRHTQSPPLCMPADMPTPETPFATPAEPLESGE